VVIPCSTLALYGQVGAQDVMRLLKTLGLAVDEKRFWDVFGKVKTTTPIEAPEGGGTATTTATEAPSSSSPPPAILKSQKMEDEARRRRGRFRTRQTTFTAGILNASEAERTSSEQEQGQDQAETQSQTLSKTVSVDDRPSQLAQPEPREVQVLAASFLKVSLGALCYRRVWRVRCHEHEPRVNCGHGYLGVYVVDTAGWRGGRRYAPHEVILAEEFHPAHGLCNNDAQTDRAQAPSEARCARHGVEVTPDPVSMPCPIDTRRHTHARMHATAVLHSTASHCSRARSVPINPTRWTHRILPVSGRSTHRRRQLGRGWSR
jgi:hypothetical protein